MATPSASDATTEESKWSKLLTAENSFVRVADSLTKEVERIVSVAKQVDKIDDNTNKAILELTNSMKELRSSGDAVLSLAKSFVEVEKDLKSLKTSKSFDSEGIKKAVEDIKVINGIAKTFKNRFSEFREHLGTAVAVCTRLVSEYKKAKEEKDKTRTRKKMIGSACATVCGIGSVALAIAAFFTFGATVPGAVALGAVAVAAAGGTAAIGVTSYLDMRKLDKSAAELSTSVNCLTGQLKELNRGVSQVDNSKESIGAIAKECSAAVEAFDKGQKHEKEALVEENRTLKEREANRDEEFRRMKEEIERLEQLAKKGSDEKLESLVDNVKLQDE